ncbi:(2Fe-2S)-binding protein [Aquicoccus porphyridii]|uniref:(2Fe-2S)-binding protein n=2 Tax=Aquicoccus porphyridii TaxID=1852029 RepID=A0A5A9Z6W9_9RHOB|nr:(2Fe-2S)-binding protein [Aquicoccus porphyridii]RAI54360.1 (2Fe-2S)-binding protein [Rhodobacteraceae bacterium AsT-22]
MIVCHCMNITDKDIRSAIEWMRRSDPDTIVTPGKVYHALGKRADCGGCLPHFMATMETSDSFQVPATLRNMRQRKPRRTAHERRQESY